MLHITNGDIARGLIERSGLPGPVIAWRDVLHEGPLPAGLSLDELREVRARFIAESGWGDYATVLAQFKQRDAALAGFRDHYEVVLWFEHDLYDQLQLVQLLEWFAPQDWAGTRLSLVCIDAHPGVDRFYGLGQLSPGQLATLCETRERVRDSQLALGRRAWEALCAPDPTAIEALLAQNTSALPFLTAALRRHLQQFPSRRNGLSRTENQALEALAAGSLTPRALFDAVQAKEQAPFMGDAVFWLYLERLASGRTPLLAEHGAEVRLTRTGLAVQRGEQDCIKLRGIDRWLGGVHLSGREADWRWDEARGRLARITRSA